MAGELQTAFGHGTREVRRQRGLTQEAMAETLGVHPNYLGDVERGTRNLSFQTAERLSEGLGEHPLDLLDVGRQIQLRAAASGEDPDAETGGATRPAPERTED